MSEAVEDWMRGGLATEASESTNKSPYHLLYQAILESWFHDWQYFRQRTHTMRGLRLFEEADDWLTSDDRSWPASFRNVCDHCGIDPEYLRAGVERLRRSADRRLKRLGPNGQMLPVGVHWRGASHKHPYRVARNLDGRYVTKHFSTLKEALAAQQEWKVAS